MDNLEKLKQRTLQRLSDKGMFGSYKCYDTDGIVFDLDPDDPEMLCLILDDMIVAKHETAGEKTYRDIYGTEIVIDSNLKIVRIQPGKDEAERREPSIVRFGTRLKVFKPGPPKPSPWSKP